MTEGDQQEARLLEILEKNRTSNAADVPVDLLGEIAAIQQQNQFDDDRKQVRKEMRAIVEYYAKSQALKETTE
jgi:hypothetical protein